MKTKYLTSAAFAAAMCVGWLALAEDLTVGLGETVDLSTTETYDTVMVHGTLNIESGALLNATTLELGPDVGDEAVVNVLGSGATGLNVTTVNVGRNGGTGKIVALSPGATHNTGWDSVCIVKVDLIDICANAAVSSSGYVDFLRLGPGTVNFRTMRNDSSSTARVLVNNGCLGYSQHWGKTMFYLGSFRIEAFDGGNIRFGCDYGLRTLSASCNMAIDGGGHDVVFCRYANLEDHCYVLNAGLEWVNVRNVYAVENHALVLNDNNLMPYGPGAGGVILKGGDPVSLRIGSTVQHLNFFSSPRNITSVSISGSVGSKVIFGDGDTDGFLKGRIHDNIGVFKVGSGLFSITNAAQVGAFTISNGTVRVAAEFVLKDLVVESGATLVVDGVTVEPSSGTALVRGNLVLRNGGQLRTSHMVEQDERIAGFCSAGEWTKDGAGGLIIEDPLSMPSNVVVKAGTLAFTAPGYSCDLYRWTVTNWNNTGWFDSANGAKANMFYLGELAFVDLYGNRIGQGTIGNAAIGTSPGDLAAGKASFADGTTLMSAGGSGNAGNLFDNNQWPRVGVASPLTTNDCGVTLYVRLPSDSGPVAAINFKTVWGGCPKSWILSGSADGGQTWKVLNKEEFVVSLQEAQQFKWFGSAESGVPLAFRFNSADADWTVPGVANMPSAMQIEVASGAVADFTNVSGGQMLDALTLDASAGGGTIKNALFAESGTLFLKNVAPGTSLRTVAVRLTLEDAQDVENLSGWRICVDGVMQPPGKYRAEYGSDGFLHILGKGLSIIFR